MKEISILLPIRNGARFLPNSIKTISENLKQNDEVVVVDDGSTDETLEILKRWKSLDSRVSIIVNKNHGLSNALNLGMEIASKEIIARFDVDDTYSVDRLDEQRSLLNGTNIAVFCDYNFVDANLEKNLGRIPSGVTGPATSVSLAGGVRTPHPGVLFDKSAAIEAGGYRSEDKYCEDLSLWLRMSRIGKLVSSPKYLLNYRLHPSSVSIRHRKESSHNKLKLLTNVGVNPVDLLLLIEELEETLTLYKKLPDGERRTILLLYDLLSATKYEKRNTVKLIQISPLFSRRYSARRYYKVFKELSFEKKMRTEYRNNWWLPNNSSL
jgi:glycosyltransferase involved in cell wall biosynthesis